MTSMSKKIALGGMLIVLCIFSLYLAAYLPTNRLFFYGLSSLFSSIMLVEAGARWSWIFYGATSILSFFIIPNKPGLLPYITFFGFYGIVKYYIEGIDNLLVCILLKGAFFIFSMSATALIVKELFMGDVYSKLPIWGLAIIGIIIFYIYDYVYTRFLIYYETRLKR